MGSGKRGFDAIALVPLLACEACRRYSHGQYDPPTKGPAHDAPATP
jgi:hypothetical protein